MQKTGISLTYSYLCTIKSQVIMKKLGLLPRIVIAIVMGVLLGNVLPEAWVRIFVTFNALFSQFLGFLIPLIII